jgi:hypothetical protein
MKFVPLFTLLVVALLFTSSCISHTILTQPSGSFLNLELKHEDYTILGVGEGQACKKALFGLIPLGGEKTYREAVRRAVAEKGGDILIQTSADQMSTLFLPILPIYYESCIFVEGIVIKFK